jgi:cobalt-zinc-cadmium resistance protein CzcA
MENWLSRFVSKPLLIILFFTACFFGGLWAFQTLPIDAFPDLTNNQVEILTEAPGMAPVEAEQLVTIPIESMMNGLPKVEQIRSISKFGLSVVTIVFQDDVDLYFARQLVNERLQTVKVRLGGGINPEMGPITTAMGEIYQYVIEGYGYSPTELKTLHDWDVKFPLRTVPGVNEVNSWGGYNREIQVLVRPERLLQYHLTLAELFHALSNNNGNFSGGLIEHSSEQFVIRGLGRVRNLADIRQILIKNENGTPITVGQVATVIDGQAMRQGAVTKDGNGEVVTGIVMMLKGENSRAVIERIKEKLSQLRHSLPEGVHIHPFYDQTRLVEQTVKTVESNLLEGGLLVIGVLLLMLGDLRAALIVAVTIPLSLMFSFMGMKALGITANIMSLGAIDFGMIVDGSIVMVENTLRHLVHRTEETAGLSTLEVVQQSVREIARPIFFGVLIITVVYAPLLSLDGMAYKLFSPMVLTISFALLGSLLIALLLVPVLCTIFLKGNIVEKEPRWLTKMRQPYARLLAKALAHPRWVAGIASVVFLLTMMTVPLLGTEFVPELDEGDLIIEMRNLPSISLLEAIHVSTRVEQTLKDLPEIRSLVSKTGRPDLATDPMGVYQTDVYVMLRSKASWPKGMSKECLVQEMRQRLQREVPGTTFNFTQPISMRVNELVSGVRADLAIKIFGEDLGILSQKAAEIERVMRGIKGQADLQTEKLAGSTQLLITPNRVKMAIYGVQLSDLRELMDTAITGKQVSEVLEGRKRFALRVKFPEGQERDPLSLGNLLVETPSGQRLPLSLVAKVETGEGLEVVNREFGERRIIVQMNVRNRDIGSFVQEGKIKLAKQVSLPPGYRLEWGGQFQNQQRAMARLVLVVPLSILIIFLLLMATFSSVRHASLVILNVPFALIGGVLALWIRGLYLSIPATVGFIALFGVAILNGLVLISSINHLREGGLPLKEAIIQGAETRLRPVLMTALVATLGFLPMALSTGTGAEIQKPLATVVIGGLMTSTMLTLVLLPVLYRWVETRFSKAELFSGESNIS